MSRLPGNVCTAGCAEFHAVFSLSQDQEELMEDRLTIENRLSTLEAENLAAKPMHEQFQQDISDLKVGQARIETKLDGLLKVNGRSNGRRGSLVAAGSGMGVMGLLAALLRWLGV